MVRQYQNFESNATANSFLSKLNYYHEHTKVGFFQICLAGMLDSMTTLVALNVFSISELNPLVNLLYPENVILIPFLLVIFAFCRYFVSVSLFKKSKNLKYAVFFTLYFLPIWNMGNLIYWNFL